MSTFRSIFRLWRSSAGLEDACEKVLREHPDDLVAIEILARRSWADKRHDSALAHATHALSITPNSREMLLIAAASSYRQGHFAEAQRFARLGIEAPSPALKADAVLESRVLKLLSRMPALERHLSKLKDEVRNDALDDAALLAWAKQFADVDLSRDSHQGP